MRTYCYSGVGKQLRYRRYVRFLAVSAMLTNAAYCVITPAPAVAGEPPANSAVHPMQPATLQTPAPSPFTEVQLAKFNHYWDTRPDKESEIIPKYSRLIGLTTGDEVVRVRRMGGRDENKVYHLFARLKNAAGYILTRETNPNELHMYWVGFDFKVIAAISDSKDNGVAVLAVQDAEKELQSEYADWAKVADKL